MARSLTMAFGLAVFLAASSAEGQFRLPGVGGGGRPGSTPNNPPRSIAPIGQPPATSTPLPRPTPPTRVNPPVVGNPPVQVPRFDPTRVVRPNIPGNTPSTVQTPAIIKAPTLPGRITPPAVTLPNLPGRTPPVVGRPILTPKSQVPGSPPNTGLVSKVLPRVDVLKNPRTTFDPSKTNPSKWAEAQKAQNFNRQRAEEMMIADRKKQLAEFDAAKAIGRDKVWSTLPATSREKYSTLERTRLEREQLMQTKFTPKIAPSVAKDWSKLVAAVPATRTNDLARSNILTGSQNASLAKIKQSANDPFAQATFDKVLKNRLASPTEISFLQAQLNNPNLNVGSRSAIASALQNQSNLRRQHSFALALNQLNGNILPGPLPAPAPLPFPGGGNGGGAFAGGFVGGLIGGLVGNLVYPGCGVIVPPYYDPSIVLPQHIVFNHVGLVGYVDYAPAVYYPPTEGLANSGCVVVQTLPCACAPEVVEPGYDPSAVTPGADNVSESTPDGQPAVVIDPTSQVAKLTTRYLRLINSSKEKVTVSVIIRTPDEEGSFLWLPEEPGKGEAAFTVEVMPGEEKDVYAGETPLHGSRARIWATGETGRTWRQFENVDFWLVPETEDDGTHAYSAPGMETAVFNLS